MNNLFERLKKSSVLKSIASIKITVVCLLLLFILTFWGTVAQVNQGLYEAQQQFFNSWYFLVFNFLPFPGAQLVLWVLFINLCAVSITRFVYRWSHIGILVIHLGLLTYFVSAFVTLHMVEESNVTLSEGQGSNVGVAYHYWEVAVWLESKPEFKKVYAFDLKGLKSGEQLSFADLGVEAAVKSYFQNAEAYVGNEAQNTIKNVSGIHELRKSDLNKEPEKNFPGIVIDVTGQGQKKDSVLLFGKESRPTTIEIDGKSVNLQVQRKRYPLPITVILKKFEMEKHPGTEIARSYKSYVTIEHGGAKRDAEIYMNHPYRYKNYTFYQASYSVDASGNMRSTLAVVRNSGRLLPYISSLLTFTGLAIHFLMMAFKRKKK
ncbi:MAG: cytochrome c biogenesis protein ResB [Candidatus Omnitrophica bacterium]|nr:cytochrome c biogenesis protein ResB [Candidatus Omnitrophota bacterium]